MYWPRIHFGTRYCCVGPCLSWRPPFQLWDETGPGEWRLTLHERCWTLQKSVGSEGRAIDRICGERSWWLKASALIHNGIEERCNDIWVLVRKATFNVYDRLVHQLQTQTENGEQKTSHGQESIFLCTCLRSGGNHSRVQKKRVRG